MYPHRYLLYPLIALLFGCCMHGCATSSELYTEDEIRDVLATHPATMSELRARLARSTGTTEDQASEELFVIAEGPSEVEKWWSAPRKLSQVL